jgi:hypothetical protein
MSDLKDKLAEAWAADLQERVPAGHTVYAMRRPAGVKPPFSVVAVMRMAQVNPASNVWVADVKMVSVCDMAQGGTTEQAQRFGELYAAVEATPAGQDETRGVELCGFSLDEVRQAQAEKVYSDIMFITAGVAGVTPLAEAATPIPDFAAIFTTALTD